MSFLGATAPVDPTQLPLLFVNFNQDSSSLQTGSLNGFKLYPVNSVETLEFTHENHDRTNVSLVERLFASSLVAIVSSDHPRKLDVCHFKKGSEICNYSYSNAILAVKLNRMRLVVCLEESMYIHNIRDMKVLHTIRDTPPNPRGVCALSPSNQQAYLAYPGSAQAGEVQVFDTITLRAVINISAHDNPLAALAFNQSGNKLATASEKGTVIRVFSLPDGEKIFEFRRGLKRCVETQCLSFSADSMYLCMTSNTETVHIFKLEEVKENRPPEDNSWMGMLNSTIKTSASYLPAGITDVMTQGRSFATARLPSAGLKSVCTITQELASCRVSRLPRLLVASTSGQLFIFSLDVGEGGECTLLKTHTLEGSVVAPSGEAGDDRPLTQPPASPSSASPPSHTLAAAPAGKAAPRLPGRHAPAGGTPAAPAPGSYLARLTGEPIPPEDPMQQVMQELADSQPYTEPLEGAEAGANLGALRINDSDEFPPMS